jgi:small subunit ribosomal protein S16
VHEVILYSRQGCHLCDVVKDTLGSLASHADFRWHIIDIDSDRAQYWLGQGAQPTEAVEALLKVTGDWQKFRGEPGAEGTLKVKAAKPSKKELYDAAIAAAGKAEDVKDTSTTPRKKAEKKAEEPAADAAAATEAPAAEAEAEKSEA